MSRIQSTTDPAGVDPYEFPRNPSEYNSQDSDNATSIDIVHGAASYQLPKWDGRPRTFRWNLIGPTTTVDPTGAAMIDTMRTWKGTVRYFNFQNLARINENWPSVTDWNKARVVGFSNSVRRGGQLRYASTELVIQPEE